MKMRKISISQRWEQRTVDKLKEFAEIAEVSQTQFTIEAINLLGKLFQIEEFKKLEVYEREELLVQLYKNYVHDNKNKYEIPHDQLTSRIELDESIIGKPGSVLRKIFDFIYDNRNSEYSTNEIADILNLTQSTVRTYVRKLAISTDKIKLIEGRPNKVILNL